MRNAILSIRNLAIGAALLATTGAFAVDLNLSPSNVTFNAPIGIDFQETTGLLVLSANYPGGPVLLNLERVDPTVGGPGAPFSTFAGLTNELKVATVRASPCLSSQRAGTAF